MVCSLKIQIWCRQTLSKCSAIPYVRDGAVRRTNRFIFEKESTAPANGKKPTTCMYSTAKAGRNEAPELPQSVIQNSKCRDQTDQTWHDFGNVFVLFRY